MSERRKRKRGVKSKDSPTRECIECAVCLCNFTIEHMTSSFACTHQFCVKCDTELFKRSTDKCPQCRKHRIDTHRSRSEIASRQALALRESSAAEPAFIFFPTQPPSLLQHGHPTNDALQSAEESLDALASLANSEDLNRALGMPLGATAMGMAEFFRHVARLRAQAPGGVSIHFRL